MALDYTEIDLVIADSPGASLDKELFEEIKANLVLLEAGVTQNGTSTFNSTTGRQITVTTMPDANYHVSITPTASPAGNLGEVWVVNNSVTQFTVYNSGSAVTAFSWAVIP